MSDNYFHIAQNDKLPKIHSILSADFSSDPDIPELEKIIYNPGDNIKLYIRRAGNWVTRDAVIEEVIDSGRQVRVSVELDAADVANPGEYDMYFRNDTISLSFPNHGELGRLIVSASGNEAPEE
jgi:hypothetical protein